jgi:glucokinase
MVDASILAGDIGGTKTSLVLCGSAGEILQQKTWQNSGYESLQAILSEFLDTLPHPPDRACFGIAGPVRDNRVRMTNLDWVLDAREISEQFAIPRVLLVNDLVATTAGAVQLTGDSLKTINSGQADLSGCRAVLAPGTGLGQSLAVANGQRLQPLPSEGGHSSFAPRTPEQIALLQFMISEKQRSHVSVEQVCSGMGIPDLYAFILTGCPEPAWMTDKRIHTAADQLTPLIVQAANAAMAGEQECEPAVKALFLFVDILAAEAANLALKVLATGGLYIGGGMPPRIPVFFEQQRFMDIFCRGVYQDMLSRIPVYIIQDSGTALIGASSLAGEL